MSGLQIRFYGLAGAAAAAFAPLLIAFFVNLWAIPEYQFFPQALAAAAFLAWSRLRESGDAFESGSGVWSWAMLALSAGLLGGAIALWSPWLAAIGALLAAGAFVLVVGGHPLLRTLMPALIVSATIVPPPLALDERLTVFLRDVATIFSSRLLDFAGVIHAVAGNVIELPGEKLMVEEACSGIHSVVFVTSFTVFFLLWRRRPAWTFVAALPVALVFVLFGNVLRIALGAWLRAETGIDILTGWKHELLSILLVLAYIGLVIGFENWICPNPPPSRQQSPKARIFDGLGIPKLPGFAWVFTALFLLLAIGSISRGVDKKNEARVDHLANPEGEGGMTFSLPEQIGGWTQVDSKPAVVNRIETLGLSSITWTYQWRDVIASVAFDYPIHGYHDVADCYSRTGWTIHRKEYVTPAGQERPFVELDLRRASGTFGALWFSTFNSKGEPMDRSTVGREFVSRFVQLGMPQGTSYRVQVLILSPDAPDTATIQAARQLLSGASEILLRSLHEQSQSANP